MKSDAVHSGMDQLLRILGIGSVGTIVGYLVRLLLEHYQQKKLEDYKRGIQKELEGYKNTLSVLANRLDFLHQERGKSALALVRAIKTAKGHINLLVQPLQFGPVDLEKACEDSHAACREVHNIIANSSFLFPKSLEDKMFATRSKLWSILDEATLLFKHSKGSGKSPFDNMDFRNLWKKMQTEFEPLEAEMTTEIRSLLGANDEHGRSA
jgi:hypothetical protein